MKIRREMFPYVSPIAQKEPNNFLLCPETVCLSSGAMQILNPVVSVVKSPGLRTLLPTGTAAEKYPISNGVSSHSQVPHAWEFRLS